MTAIEHNRYLAIGFAFFAGIFGVTFLLLMLVSLGVFVALGISFANETGDRNQAGFGILGGVFAVLFYLVMGAIFALPPALASWKWWKRKRRARTWAVSGALGLVPQLPCGNACGVL